MLSLLAKKAIFNQKSKLTKTWQKFDPYIFDFRDRFERVRYRTGTKKAQVSKIFIDQHSRAAAY